MIKINTSKQETTLFYLMHSSSFSKPGACITHNAALPLSDITGGKLSDYLQLALEPQMATQVIVLCETCKHFPSRPMQQKC